MVALEAGYRRGILAHHGMRRVGEVNRHLKNDATTLLRRASSDVSMVNLAGASNFNSILNFMYKSYTVVEF